MSFPKFLTFELGSIFNKSKACKMCSGLVLKNLAASDKGIEQASIR